jgi:hypothetical protein
VQVIPPRPTFAADMTGTKSEIMSKHVAYWTDLLDKDIAVAGRRAIGLVRHRGPKPLTSRRSEYWLNATR